MRYETYSDSRAVFVTESAEETRALGRALGGFVYPGLTLLLFGGLGMGKTQLTQGIGNALGFDRVKSPTFIIVSEHEGKLPLIHADLYRLDAKETDSLDLESYTMDGCLLVVEWAERWPSPPGEDRLDIRFEAPDGADGPRRITTEAFGERAGRALAGLCAEMGNK